MIFYKKGLDKMTLISYNSDSRQQTADSRQQTQELCHLLSFSNLISDNYVRDHFL